MAKPEIKNLSRKSKEKEEGEFKSSGSKDQDQGQGRKSIIILFIITILLSLISWLKANYWHLLTDLFGPSEWTFRR